MTRAIADVRALHEGSGDRRVPSTMCRQGDGGISRLVRNQVPRTGGTWLRAADPGRGWIGREAERQAPSRAAASAVPSTRAAILAKAISRDVEVSSAKGENPQSSQVPS